MRTFPAGRALFDRGQPVFGVFVTAFSTPSVVGVVAAAGLDFVVVDLEHSAFTFGDAAALIGAARGLDLPALVRVADGGRATVSRVLDLGADGLIVPRVSSGEEAEQVVRFAKYAPEGERGVGFVRAHDGYTRGDWATKTSAANAGTACVALVETKEGVEAIEDICAAPGLDAVWLGFADLAQSLGVAGDRSHPAFLVAEARVREICLNTGTALGVVASSSEEAVLSIQRGYSLIALGTDVTLLQDKIIDTLRSIASTEE